MHEWFHLYFNHIERIKTYDKLIYNAAADCVINNILKNNYSQYLNFPKGTLIAEGSIMEIYFRIKKSLEVFQTPRELNQFISEEDFAYILQRNLYFSDIKYGQIDDTLKIMMANDIERSRHLKKSKIPKECIEMLSAKDSWDNQLFTYLKKVLTIPQRNYSCPDARYFLDDVLIPKADKTVSNNIVIILDTSRSMTKELLETALSLIRKLSSIIGSCVICFSDAKVHKIVSSRDVNFDEAMIYGRGGTDFHHAFAVAESFHPNLILVFSDLETDLPPEPKIPCVFVSFSDRESSYGKTIKVSKWQ
jgi:predicted metal-dependent peptidase